MNNVMEALHDESGFFTKIRMENAVVSWRMKGNIYHEKV